jgi:hypothetical protein
MIHIPLAFHLGRFQFYWSLKLGKSRLNGPRCQLSLQEGNWDRDRFLSSIDLIFMLPFIALDLGVAVQRSNLLPAASSSNFIPLVRKPTKSPPENSPPQPVKSEVEVEWKATPPPPNTIPAVSSPATILSSETEEEKANTASFLCSSPVQNSKGYMDKCGLLFSHLEENCQAISDLHSTDRKWLAHDKSVVKPRTMKFISAEKFDELLPQVPSKGWRAAYDKELGQHVIIAGEEILAVEPAEQAVKPVEQVKEKEVFPVGARVRVKDTTLLNRRGGSIVNYAVFETHPDAPRVWVKWPNTDLVSHLVSDLELDPLPPEPVVKKEEKKFSEPVVKKEEKKFSNEDRVRVKGIHPTDPNRQGGIVKGFSNIGLHGKWARVWVLWPNTDMTSYLASDLEFDPLPNVITPAEVKSEAVQPTSPKPMPPFTSTKPSDSYGVWNVQDRRWERMVSAPPHHPFKDDMESADKNAAICSKLMPAGRFQLRKHHPNCENDNNIYCCEGEVSSVASKSVSEDTPSPLQEKKFGVWDEKASQWVFLNNIDWYSGARETASKEMGKRLNSEFSLREHLPWCNTNNYRIHREKCCVGEKVKSSEYIANNLFGCWDNFSHSWIYIPDLGTYRGSRVEVDGYKKTYQKKYPETPTRHEIKMHAASCTHAERKHCCVGISLTHSTSSTQLELHTEIDLCYGLWNEDLKCWSYCPFNYSASAYRSNKKEVLAMLEIKERERHKPRLTVRKHSPSCNRSIASSCCVGELIPFTGAAFGVWNKRGKHWVLIDALFRGTKAAAEARVERMLKCSPPVQREHFVVVEHRQNCNLMSYHTCCIPTLPSVETKPTNAIPTLGW